jgi:predicted nucleic acid-binding protein
VTGVDRLRAWGPPELVVGGLAAVVFLLWATADGGAAPTSLYPGSLFLLGLLCAAGFAYWRAGAWRRPSRPVALALLLLAGFVVWNFISITWADVKGDAWLGSNRALTYLIVFALFALPSWRRPGAAAVLGAYSLGVAAIAAATLIQISTSAEPQLAFVGEVLVDPTGYHNATAALFLAAFFPAVFLASRREVAWPLRGILLAGAGLLVDVALVAQSRGSAIAFALTLLLYLVLVKDRLRSAIHLGLVALAVIPAAPPLLDIYAVLRDGGDVGAAIDSGATAAWLSAGVLLVVGCALAFADRRLALPRKAIVAGERGFAVVAAVVAIAGVGAGLSATGDPVDWAEARWTDFKSGYGEDDFGSSRFSGSLGSNRYDFWRVSWNQFKERPLTGAGSESFAVDYLRERQSDEEPKHPHSLPLRILGQNGLVGTLLLGGFTAAALWAALRRRSRHDPLGYGLAVAGVATFAYWFVHASGDWHWVFPSLTAPAFAFLALGGRLNEDEGPAGATDIDSEGHDARTPRQGDPRNTVARALVPAAAVAVALVAAVSYLLPFGAARDVSAATNTWRTDPATAFDRLERARGLDFLSAEADLIAGTIAIELGEHERARAAFEAALERDPNNWYALLELGALESLAGDRAAALAHLRRALQLNPQDPLIAATARAVRGGRAVQSADLHDALRDRVCGRFGQTGATRFCE